MASSSYSPISSASTGAAPVDLSYISRGKQRVYSTLATRRPWSQVLDFHALSLPRSISDCFTRVRTNLAYFRVNAAMFSLLVLFLALLWHPISLIVLVIMMAAWLFLLFLRDQPLVVFGHTIHDLIILALLAVLTLVFLFLTSATVNILVGIALPVGVVFLFSVFRRTDHLFLDEEAAVSAGLVRTSTAHN